VSEAEPKYTVKIDQRPAKFLRKLAQGDKDSAKRIGDAIEDLKTDPRPSGCEPVKSRPGHLRVRAGDYRIVYSVQDSVLLVSIVAIGHRSDVYE
jgi:mRNA interferase RelE/StbE